MRRPILALCVLAALAASGMLLIDSSKPGERPGRAPSPQLQDEDSEGVNLAEGSSQVRRDGGAPAATHLRVTGAFATHDTLSVSAIDNSGRAFSLLRIQPAETIEIPLEAPFYVEFAAPDGAIRGVVVGRGSPDQVVEIKVPEYGQLLVSFSAADSVLAETNGVLLPDPADGAAEPMSRTLWKGMAASKSAFVRQRDALSMCLADPDASPQIQALLSTFGKSGSIPSWWVGGGGRPDGEGVVSWPAVDADTPMRWMLSGPLASLVAPPHERGNASSDWRSENETLPPQGLSASFSLRPGERRAYSVDAKSCASLRALVEDFVAGDDQSSAFMSVFEEKPLRLEDGSSGWSTQLIATVGLKGADTFYFPCLEAGLISYDACWWQDGGLRWAHGYVHLEGGLTSEIALTRVGRNPIEIIGRYVGAEDGAVLGEFPLSAVELFLVSDQSVGLHADIKSPLPPGHDARYKIDGLADGGYRLRAHADVWPELPNGHYVRSRDVFWDYSVPEELYWIADVPVYADNPREIRVVLLGEGGGVTDGLAGRVEFYARDGKGQPTAVRLRQEDVGALVGAAPLSPGSYRYAVRCLLPEGSKYCEEGVLEVSQGVDALELKVTQGAGIRGVATHPDGAFVAKGTALAARSRADDWQGQWPYITYVQDAGEFHFDCLPARAEIELRRVEQSVYTPQSGEIIDAGNLIIMPR